MDSTELIVTMSQDAYAMLRERVTGLTEEEFWWEPVPNAWTVRPLADGRWATDYAQPDPIPAPFTTIGWRLVHILECKLMYDDYAFGSGVHRWDVDVSSPHTVRDALQDLDRHHASLIEHLRERPAGAWQAGVQTNWGERWPAWRIAWTLIKHDLWHGGEIGVLRDLYAVGVR